MTVVEWAQAAAIVGTLTAVMGLVVGLQTFWIARALDTLRDEMHRGFDRLDATDRPPRGIASRPSLRRV